MCVNTGNSRSRSAPMQVSIMIRRLPALITNAWKLMSIRPCGVA